MKIKYLAVGSIVVKVRGEGAGLMWRVTSIDGGVHIQCDTDPSLTWKGANVREVSYEFLPYVVDETAEFIKKMNQYSSVLSKSLKDCFDHELKIDPERLVEVLSGDKTHEIRIFDREFKVGDILKLNAYDRLTQAYTGQSTMVQVTNITPPGSYGLPEKIGVMSIALIDSKHPGDDSVQSSQSQSRLNRSPYFSYEHDGDGYI